MQTAARMAAHGQAHMEYGEVVQFRDSRFLVKTGSGLCQADRATGCLVAPELGDRVLVADDGSGEAYILSVLARASKTPAHVGVTGPMVLGDADAGLALRGDTVRLAAGRAMELAATDMAVVTQKTTVRTNELDAAGTNALVAFSSIKSVFASIHQTAGRVLSRFKRVYTRIDDFEDERVGRKRLFVHSDFDISSQRTVLHAQKNVDVKADKINLG
ncbi:DUF3540 domain-containing protein [Desulfovibrio inopinatus]|uniref:DUF3540 domain-containing protein n=1 Tax=Desulfovibrio inopinatus TaxID=102109 RepID=UPI00042868BE|nr:DUF3540 domain-containing protein [Desulfovibrio inopinatus]